MSSIIFPSKKNNYLRKSLSGWVQTLSDELTECGCFRTARAYRTTLNSFLNFCGKKDLFPDEITEKLIVTYERSLKERKLSLNTISFYMRNLRAICNKGNKQKLFNLPTQNMFSRVYTKVAVSRKRALTKQEMKGLENLLADPILPKEEKDTLRLFMFAFHARGMSFVDLAYLKKSDINLKGNTFSYFRRKTGQFIEVSLNRTLRQMIHYFMENNSSSPFLFPIIRDHTQQTYMQYCTGLRMQNQRLKQVAVRARLGKGLSTHQARHAWATIAKNENIPVWVISEGLGHTSVATTYIYLDSFGTSVLDQAHRKVSQAISKVC
ncbi:MAG: site-specific integrase [Tannerellaceae bacterium]|nr:site-specific integrase [Tannerellaceae bacterium]